MATLGSLFGGSAYAMSGPKAPASKTPAINAANEEEEKFIKYAQTHAACQGHSVHLANRPQREFLAQVNADELKEKNAAKH